MKTLKAPRRRVFAVVAVVCLAMFGGAAAYAATVPNPDPCDSQFKNTITGLRNYTDCRLDRIERAIPEATVTVTVTAPPTSTTTSPTSTTTSPTSTTTTSTTTSPTTTTTTTTQPASWDCVKVGNVTCGAYQYPKITNSNGYNTYTSTDCWGHPGCDYKLESNNPGDFQVTANEPAGNTAVVSYPDAQQLTNNWNPTTHDFTGFNDLPRAALSGLSSTYSENMNEQNGTAAQAAWDIWTSSGEKMIWVDEVGRGSGGANTCGTGTLSGHPFTYYVYGGSGAGGCTGGLAIIKLDTNLRAGTIDLGAALDYFTSVGQFTADGTIGQINFGWEVCSTGGAPETFRMLDYSLTMTPK